METFSLRKHEKHSINPFLMDDGVIKIERGKKAIIMGGTKDILVDQETGETKALGVLAKYQEVDRTKFVKIYVNEIKNIFDLSTTGYKVFAYLLTCIKINNDEIYLNIQDCVDFCKWKATVQVYRGLGELMKNEIIAQSKKSNIWFINPNIIFNGDRFAFIKQYTLKNEKQLPADPLLPLFSKQEVCESASW